MAIDNRSKRASAIFPLLPHVITGPAPDGALDAGDRQHIAWMYSGIPAAAPPATEVALYIPTFRPRRRGTGRH